MTHRGIFALALGLLLGFGGPAGPAGAQSVNRCIDQCFNGVGDQPGSTVLRDLCVKQCGKRATPYGAIAYGAESTAIGWSYDYGTKAEAERRALGDCAQHGDDCKIVASLFNSCAAVAAGANKRFAVGEAPKSEDAQSSALAACTRQGGTNCEVQAWSCAFK